LTADATIPEFPFVALVGQAEMKLGLLLNVVDPSVGGLLLLGERGTGKSTAVRALASLMPDLRVVAGCPFHCAPERPAGLCAVCAQPASHELPEARVPVPVVDLPLGATEDRVTGTLDLEAALVRGERSFEPGLVARAHRGFLYIDEVNLLEDHLVDLLLDVAASGENVVEREAISVRHPARFVLVGSGNPEEGELRPQLVDRFGLCVEVRTEQDVEARVEITRRRMRFEDEPKELVASFAAATAALRVEIEAARQRLATVELPAEILADIARLNAALDIPGHRGELTIARAARTLAALENRAVVTRDDVRRLAPMALRHRLRRDPLETGDVGHRLDQALTAWAES
jgi:magnesium chelatase subunit I